MIQSLINTLQQLPDPSPPQQSLQDLLQGRFFFHLRADLHGQVIPALEPIRHITDSEASLAQVAPSELGELQGLNEEAQLSLMLNRAGSLMDDTQRKDMTNEIITLYCQKYNLSTTDITDNSLTFALAFHPLHAQVKPASCHRLASGVKWSKPTQASLRGPHRVKLTSPQVAKKLPSQKKPAKDLLREMQILGGLLESKLAEEEEKQVLDYFTTSMRMVNLNPDWVLLGQKAYHTTPSAYDDFFGGLYQHLRDDNPNQDNTQLYPKASTPITQAMLESIIDKIGVEEREEKAREEQTEFEGQAIPLVRLPRATHRYAQEDVSDISHFYEVLPKSKFAVEFPFELDQFQKRAVLHLERGESVFVAAHTSAGKTVVAEYGIALANKHKRKTVYTSPIKALSNQKFREFSQKFESVGILTGDISLNPEASCVIMTTEILRNNLYKGADMIRDIEWVVFDQVHYVNNRERGVVWEETILMLPQHIGLIMLSATVPNYMDFADWVGRTKHRQIFVMKTLYRPVPLEHSIYLFKKFHVVKEAGAPFEKQAYKELKKMISNAEFERKEMNQKLKNFKHDKIQTRGFWNDNRRQQHLKLLTKKAIDKFIKKVGVDQLNSQALKTEASGLIQLIIECEQKELLPAVVFIFSKRKINDLAAKIYIRDLNSNSEKQRVTGFFAKAVAHLKPQDRQLPQLRQVHQLARNGYSIHHGDLMPLAKEIVELLFGQGLVKVLLATETFAMGINMPTRTVIFHSLKKIDSDALHFTERYLNSSEYVQMSGRAGRRGLDQKGHVIIWERDPSNLPQELDLRNMMDHHGEQLVSKFKVTYQIILNLLVAQDLTVLDMIRNSFLENDKFSAIPRNQERIRKLKVEYDELSHILCQYMGITETLPPIEEFNDTCRKIRSSNTLSWNALERIPLPRLGVIIGIDQQLELCAVIGSDHHHLRVLLVRELDFSHSLREREFKKKQRRQAKIAQEMTFRQVKGTKLQYSLVNLPYSQVVDVFGEKLDLGKGRISSSEDSYETYEALAKLIHQRRNQIDLLSQLAIPASLIKGDFQSKRSLYPLYAHSRCRLCKHRDAHLEQLARKAATRQELQDLIERVDRNDLAQKANFAGMVRVLKELHCIDKEELMLLKGRIAREVGDIYVAEIMLGGILEKLEPAGIGSILSGFVNQFKPRKSEEESRAPPMPGRVGAASREIKEMVKSMARLEVQCAAYFGDEEEIVKEVLNYSLMPELYWWADGLDFILICEFSEAQQGIIIKTILRLEILLRNMQSACNLMGNQRLKELLAQTSDKIKRDVVFSQSLYLK